MTMTTPLLVSPDWYEALNTELDRVTAEVAVRLGLFRWVVGVSLASAATSEGRPYFTKFDYRDLKMLPPRSYGAWRPATPDDLALPLLYPRNFARVYLNWPLAGRIIEAMRERSYLW